MIRRVPAAIALIVIAAILLVAAWPQLFSLEAQPIIAQVVSLRGVDVAIAIVLLIAIVIAALAWRRARGFLAAVATLLLVFCVASVAVLATRGYDQPTAATTSPGQVTVLSWNTKGAAAGAHEIAKVALAVRADVLALPETRLRTGVEVAELMKAAGRPMWVKTAAYDQISPARSTTLLISSALGTYTVDNTQRTTSVEPTVIATPTSGDGPTFIAVHAVSPKPKEMRNWRFDLNYLSTICRGPNTIMAGDFNATTDTLHPLAARGADFGSCTDAGLASHGASVGSWPTSLPWVLGAQIDHVMYYGAWRVGSMHVILSEDSTGSDHRPVVVTLVPSH